MSRKCTICTHPARDAIEAAIRDGAVIQRLASNNNVTESAIRRHRDNCLAGALRAAAAADEQVRLELSGLPVLEQARELQRRTAAILDGCEDAPLQLRAIRECRENLALLARLLGDLDERPQINLVVSPEWAALRGRILAALDRYPEARLALAAALERDR